MIINAKGLAKNEDGTVLLFNGEPLPGARVAVYVPTTGREDGSYVWKKFPLANEANTDTGTLTSYLFIKNKPIVVAGKVLKIELNKQIPFVLIDRSTGMLVDAWFPPDYDNWLKNRAVQT